MVAVMLEAPICRLAFDPAVKWPNWVAPEIRNHHSMLEQLAAEHKCSLLDLAIGFAHSQQDLESVVFGLCSKLNSSS